jgi:predicted transcriptional regulator
MAMTLRLTDEEAEALRTQASAEGRSMQDVAREAVREYVDRHARRAKIDEITDRTLERYADVFDRLGK